jgi:hypothetical protein
LLSHCLFLPTKTPPPPPPRVTSPLPHSLFYFCFHDSQMPPVIIILSLLCRGWLANYHGNISHDNSHYHRLWRATTYVATSALSIFRHPPYTYFTYILMILRGISLSTLRLLISQKKPQKAMRRKNKEKHNSAHDVLMLRYYSLTTAFLAPSVCSIHSLHPSLVSTARSLHPPPLAVLHCPSLQQPVQ